MNDAQTTLQTLRTIAAENGLPTVQAWADAAGISRPRLSEYMRGVKSPSLEKFLRLCSAAGVEVNLKIIEK